MYPFKIRSLFAAFGLLSASVSLACGNTFAPAAGQPGSTAIASSDSSIAGWASSYVNYQPGTDVSAGFQTPAKALHAAGDSDGQGTGFIFDIVSLGRGGQITLTFYPAITNGEGCDFAIFENSFSDMFLELAWVEVSSNGIDFFRFAGASLTPGLVAPYFATMNATDIEGFAGKYRGGYGTPFDLDNLPNDPALDKSRITHVRLIDIVGDGNELDSLTPPVGPNPIYDPYPTVDSAGFDLDAIAVLNAALPEQHNVPLPTAYLLLLALLLLSCTRQKPVR